MDTLWLTQGPVQPGGDWGSLVPVLALIASAATVVATAIVNRRRGKSDFMSEVLREVEYLRARNYELEKRNTALDDQNRTLGKENVALLRDAHKGMLEWIERMVERIERIQAATPPRREGGRRE